MHGFEFNLEYGMGVSGDKLFAIERRRENVCSEKPCSSYVIKECKDDAERETKMSLVSEIKAGKHKTSLILGRRGDLRSKNGPFSRKEPKN